MTCSRCGADCPAGARFCGQCGAALSSNCPSCGATNPPEYKFCAQCGTPLDPAGLEVSVAPGPDAPRPQTGGVISILPGEMKQVTVLFCDIVNSTALTERLGPEGMRDLVSSFLDASLAEVRRYGGTAPQFLGDGFMAVFGAPVTQEDHVQRALLAALGIQRALSGAADPLAPGGKDKLDLPVRIGIHTGSVVFGPIADGLSMDDTVIGDTANLAARLQQAAEPGIILLSEATYRLAQIYVRTEPVGPLILKGKPDPVSAFRLLEISQTRAALRASTVARTTTFVDRQSDQTILYNFLRQVENGHRQAVGIVGEPGIGKSRLLAEFRRQLGAERATWLEGRCLSYGTGIPYLLVLDILRSHCGILESDSQEAIAEKVGSGLRGVGMDPEQDSPVLCHLLGIKDLSGMLSLSNPAALKAITFEIFRKLTIQLSLERPLILVLEDLHWIDEISEELLGFLAENVPNTRVLILASYRPGYRPPWIDKSYAGQIPLQPLSRDDSIYVIRSVLHTERLIELLTEEIVAKGDGNPFFLEQLTLHAGEAARVRLDLMVPNTIHDVVMARIDRLPEAMKRILQTAAVIGREFSSRLLAALWPDAGSLDDQLRELCRLEFIYERVEIEGAVYIFRHALTQETAYGSLLERQRRALHAAIGLALETLYCGRTEEVAELLALHFGRSDKAEKAVDYAILAARKSQRRWANSDALTYFNDALRRLDTIPDSDANRLRRIDAVLDQAEVKYALGQYTEHLQALEEIRSLLDQTDDPRRRAGWNYWTGFLHSVSGGRPEIAIGYCREAAKIASTAGLDDINAFAESCLAQIYVVAGRLHDAVETGERALSSFEAQGNLWWAARTLWFLCVAANGLGAWEQSVQYCRRGIDYGIALEELRFKSVQVVGWWRMGSAYIQQGDLERGLRCCREAVALTPIPRDAVMAKASCAYADIKAGRFDAGIAGLTETLAWFDHSDLRFTHQFYGLWLAEGHLRGGDRLAARPLIEDLLNTCRNNGYFQLEGRACWLMGECLAAEDSVAAEGYVETAMRISEDVGARNDLARVMVTRAGLRQKAGDLAAARELLDQAGAIFETLGTLDEPARVKSALAALDRGSQIPMLAGVS